MSLAALISLPVSARTVIAPVPAYGARCEVTLERGAFGPVEAIGHGKYIQRGIENRPGMPPMPGFLFVDCNKGQAASISEKNTQSGVPDPYVVNRMTTVDALMRLSNERGDVNSRLDGPPAEGGLIDPYCGCAVLFPASKASSWAK